MHEVVLTLSPSPSRSHSASACGIREARGRRGHESAWVFARRSEEMGEAHRFSEHESDQEELEREEGEREHGAQLP